MRQAAQPGGGVLVRRLPARWPTYGLLLGSLVGILAVGLAVPALVAHPTSPQPANKLFVTPPLLPPGPPADHDPRLPPPYSNAQLVTGVPPPAGVALTASDVGITPSSITLGVILPNLGVIQSFGIDVSELNPKTQMTYWQSAVDRVNAAGGIAGRHVDLVYATASILSTDSQRQACRSLTEDHRVFAVANMLGITGDPVLCVTRDHATPYLGVDGEPPGVYQSSRGRLVTLEPSTSRALTVFLDRAEQLGLIKGHRIGVVHGIGPYGVDGTAFAKALRKRGAKAVIDGPLGNEDPLVITGQVAAAEHHMYEAGVDTVALFTNAVYGTVFATQADQDHYSPGYLLTDLVSATAGDSFPGNMPPTWFRQALAVTTTEIGRGRGGLPESPLDAGCRLAYQRFIRHAVPRDGADAVASLAGCAVLQLLTMGVNAAGPNPTRAGFAAALGRVGAFAVPGFGRALLEPGHADAADVVAVAAGHADCQCWFAIDGYRPVASVIGGPG